MKVFNYTAAEYEENDDVQEYAREIVYDYLQKYCVIEKPVLGVFADYYDPDDEDRDDSDLEFGVFHEVFDDDTDWGYEAIYEQLFSESDMDEDEVAAIWDETVTVLEDNGVLNMDHLSDEYEFCEFAFSVDEIDELSVQVPKKIYRQAVKAFSQHR
jgi:hypothetical protein